MEEQNQSLGGGKSFLGQKPATGGGKSPTTLGMDQNVEAVLTYVLGFVSGIAFLVLEKENKYVRFHAAQSTIAFIALSVVMQVISYIPLIGMPLATIILFGTLLLWVLLMYKAYQGIVFKLPYAGEYAEKLLKK